MAKTLPNALTLALVLDRSKKLCENAIELCAIAKITVANVKNVVAESNELLQLIKKRKESQATHAPK